MICRDCSAELRFGRRDDKTGWWHKDNVDHVGFPVVSPESGAKIEAIPEPEIRAHDVNPQDFSARSSIRQVYNLVLTHEWEPISLTASRGPYLGSKGEVLSFSDSINLRARKVGATGLLHVAIASWRDGKFDFSYIGVVNRGNLSPTRVSYAQLKKWLKGIVTVEELLSDRGTLREVPMH